MYDHLSLTQRNIANTLSNFALIQPCELHDVVRQLSSSTCALDMTPTKMFKNVFSCMVEDVLDIVNVSLLSGTFPSCLKHAVVKPLLKKNNLDPLVFDPLQTNIKSSISWENP